MDVLWNSTTADLKRNLELEEELNLAGNPFMIGRWVRGRDHYGRTNLVEYLLTAHDSVYWVVGTRRTGKTSLLRHLETIADNRESQYVPFFWDLSGCVTPADFATELQLVIEDASARFAGLGVELAELEADDAATILRRLGRSIARSGRQLLLLVDAAGALVDPTEQNAAWLARLRKSMQDGRQRTIIASAKLPPQMNACSANEMINPFLTGLQMVNLKTLDPEDGRPLIHKSQSEGMVTANDALVEQILDITNGQPHLIQRLCQRLYIPGIGGGSLRRINDDDLTVDSMLASYLRDDYVRLVSGQRRILLAAAETEALNGDDLCERFGGCAELRLDQDLDTLVKLGHLRCDDAAYALGNSFLERWLTENHRALMDELSPVEENASGAEIDKDDLAALARTLGVSIGRVQAIAKRQITTEEQFRAAVKSFFYEIRHLVEQDDGYRLLITTDAGGTPVLRSEEEVQIALKHWLRPMCRALNIHMERGSSTGRGFLDFAFSLGHDFRCVVEVKPYHSLRLQEGVGIQLPTCMIADRTEYGIYVPIILESTDYDEIVQELERLAAERAKSHGVKIDVMDIRAWKPETASKADDIEVRNRYHPDGLALPRSVSRVGSNGTGRTEAGDELESTPDAGDVTW